MKQVIRLIYDEPGRAKDQPLTIVHRGVIIKIGKSSFKLGHAPFPLVYFKKVKFIMFDEDIKNI